MRQSRDAFLKQRGFRIFLLLLITASSLPLYTSAAEPTRAKAPVKRPAQVPTKVTRKAPPKLPTLRAYVFRHKDPKKLIRGLEFSSKIYPSSIRKMKDGEWKYVIGISGALVGKKDWNFMLENRAKIRTKAAPGGKTLFYFPVALPETVNLVTVSAISPNGKAEIETFQIRIDDSQNILATLKKKEMHKDAPQLAHKAFAFNASAGPSWLTYAETLSPEYSAVALTVKAAAFYFPQNRPWNLGLNGFFTAATLSSNQPSVTLRYLGVNARAGYVLPWIRSPWQVSVLAGTYFTTMFVNPAEFGYRNLMGPQLFPAIGYTLPNQDKVNGYFKFSPVASSFSLLDLTNREIAFGAGYSRRLPAGQSLSFNADFATLKLNIQGIEIEARSFSLSAGYGF